MPAKPNDKKPARASRTQKPQVEDESPEVKLILERQAVQIRDLEQEAVKGERMENFYRGGAYEILNAEILMPFEAEVVNTIKNPAFSIENREQLYQFQASLRVIQQIRERIEKKIRAGMDARAQILQIQEANPPVTE